MRQSESHTQYWPGTVQFYATTYMCTTGLTNLIWFPYAVYKRGRGTYLIIYTIVTAAFVIPLMYLESIMGQFSHSGNRGVFESAPVFAGVSYTMAYFNVVTSITGAVTISYAILYLFRATDDPMPWYVCNQADSDICYSVVDRKACKWIYRNLSKRFGGVEVELGIPLALDDVAVIVPTQTLLNETANCTPGSFSSVAVFHRDEVLHLSSGIHDLGQFQIEMAIASAITWLVVYGLIIFHVTSFRLAVYSVVVVRVFTIAFIIAKVLASPGENCGFNDLFRMELVDFMSLDLWKQAAERSIYSVGCSATFLRLMSWNRFHNDYRWNVYILACLDIGTTVLTTVMVFVILGFLAETTHTDINDLFISTSAPFVTILEALAMLEPHRDFIILYCGLILLMSIGRMILVPEMAVEVLRVEFPTLKGQSVYLKLCFCVFSYSCSLLLCTSVGPYVVVLLEYYFHSVLGLLITIIEMTVLVYAYGVSRIQYDSKMMICSSPGGRVRVIWSAIPFILIVLYSVGLLKATEVSYDGYFYPVWAKAVGMGIAVAGLAFIPCYACAFLMANKDLRLCLTPSNAWGPNPDAHMESEYLERALQSCNLASKQTSLTKASLSERGATTDERTDYSTTTNRSVVSTTMCTMAPEESDRSSLYKSFADPQKPVRHKLVVTLQEHEE